MRSARGTAQMDALDIVTLIFDDGKLASVNWHDIKNVCPPVLTRLLGRATGFRDPSVDDNGYLTFPISYGIGRRAFVDCITFLRCGMVTDFERVSGIFNALGGCPELDEWFCLDLQHQRHLEQERLLARDEKRANPLTPEDDVDDLFHFKLGPCTGVTNDWKPTTHALATEWWYRKRRPPGPED